MIDYKVNKNTVKIFNTNCFIKATTVRRNFCSHFWVGDKWYDFILAFDCS